jgi:hypothetical protein
MKENSWLFKKILLPAIELALKLLHVPNASDFKTLQDDNQKLQTIVDDVRCAEKANESEIDLFGLKLKELETKLERQIELEVKQAFEANSISVEEQIDSFNSIVGNHSSNIRDIASKYIELSGQFEKILDSKASAEAPDEVKELIVKARTDAAKAIKNTREKVSDLDVKLDAFIDTVSDRLAALKKK